MLLHGVRWKDDVVLREALDIPSLRMTFRYERVERSRFLPDLDLALITRLAALPDPQDALDELRNLRG